MTACKAGRPVPGPNITPDANGHSAFGSWAVEETGNPITDVMRALRQPSKPQWSASGADADLMLPVEDRQAQLQQPDDPSGDDAEVSWWDTDLPGEDAGRGGGGNGHHVETQSAEGAEGAAADAAQDYAPSSRVWQRDNAIAAETQASPEALHSFTHADQRPAHPTEAAWPAGQQPGSEAAQHFTEACSSAEEQWRLAYAQWYEAYMHWYASYEQWHTGYQQHCAGQATGSGPVRQQAPQTEREQWPQGT